MDAGVNVAAVVTHHGEEPAISGARGICNVFFAGCNLGCVYCQNHQISLTGRVPAQETLSFDRTLERICLALEAGCRSLGFVTPSHLVPQMLLLIHAVRSRGYDPVIVYNTGGYDLPGVIDRLGEVVDVWLPDFKYSDQVLAKRLSRAGNYPEVALKALERMLFHKGTTLRMDGDIAVSGLIVRHLVLPGEVDNSLGVLRLLEDHFGPALTLSLMSQYHPTSATQGKGSLERQVYAAEYAEVVAEAERLGFHRGWIQALDSPQHYRPDFIRENPFD